VAKAICSFANTLGGRVLIGVTNGQPNAGEADGREPVEAFELTDRVRQALQANRVDPVPAFAATVRDIGDPPQPVAITRVYESDDAPHVIRNGQVFVRSVAEDQMRNRVYRPGGVETQSVLIDLVERPGERTRKLPANQHKATAHIFASERGTAAFGQRVGGAPVVWSPSRTCRTRG